MPRDDDVSGVTFFKRELEASLGRISSLEKENQELKQEMVRLRSQVNMLKAHDIERKSMLWKKLQNSMDGKIIEESHHKPSIQVGIPEQNLPLKKLNPEIDLIEAGNIKEKPAKSPMPPTRSAPSPKELNGSKVLSTTPLQGLQQQSTPPPPPPPPSKLVGSKAVRRVPAVMEFYRSLMKRDAQKENKNNAIGSLPVTNSRDMIGEIENRSTYLSAVSTETNLYSHKSLSKLLG